MDRYYNGAKILINPPPFFRCVEKKGAGLNGRKAFGRKSFGRKFLK